LPVFCLCSAVAVLASHSPSGPCPWLTVSARISLPPFCSPGFPAYLRPGVDFSRPRRSHHRLRLRTFSRFGTFGGQRVPDSVDVETPKVPNGWVPFWCVMGCSFRPTGKSVIPPHRGKPASCFLPFDVCLPARPLRFLKLENIAFFFRGRMTQPHTIALLLPLFATRNPPVRPARPRQTLRVKPKPPAYGPTRTGPLTGQEPRPAVLFFPGARSKESIPFLFCCDQCIASRSPVSRDRIRAETPRFWLCGRHDRQLGGESPFIQPEWWAKELSKKRKGRRRRAGGS